MDTSIKRYPAKEHHQPVERICRTLELRDDPQLIAEYRRRHSQGAIWPEIPAGIREAGISGNGNISFGHPPVYDSRSACRV